MRSPSNNDVRQSSKSSGRVISVQELGTSSSAQEGPLTKTTRFEILVVQVSLILYSANFINRTNIWALGILVGSWLYIFSSAHTKLKFSRAFSFTLFILSLFFLSYGLVIVPQNILSLNRLMDAMLNSLALFLAGYSLSAYQKQPSAPSLLVIFVVVPSVLYNLLTVLITMQTFGAKSMFEIENVLRGARVLVEPWSRSLLSATNVAAYNVFGLSMSSIVFVLSKDRRENIARVMLLICFLVAAYNAFFIGGRNALVVLFSAMACAVLLNIMQRNLSSIALIILVALVVAFAYNADFLQMRTQFESSFLGQRFTQSTITDDVRFSLYKEAIQTFIAHPTGGGGFGAHNLWLDTAVTGGILPLILLGIFTIAAILILANFLSLPDVSVMIKTVYLSCFVGAFIILLSEPIMEGYIFLFSEFCFLLGAMSGISFHANLRKSSRLLGL